MKKGFIVYSRNVGKYRNIELVPFQIPEIIYDETLIEEMIKSNPRSYRDKKDRAVPGSPLSEFNNDNNKPLEIKVVEFESKLIPVDNNVKFVKLQDDALIFEIKRDYKTSELLVFLYCSNNEDFYKGNLGVNILKNGHIVGKIKIPEGEKSLKTTISDFLNDDELSFEIGW